jgi:predicted alpha/beta hydrolase family esterase
MGSLRAASACPINSSLVKSEGDMEFKSTIFSVPGLGGSNDTHWQTLWEDKFGLIRIHQMNWSTPVCDEWIKTIDRTVLQYDPGKVILVGHDLGCLAIAFWYGKFQRKIKGALLVAPRDTEAEASPSGATGFSPIPLSGWPFQSTVVASSDDPFLQLERAALFAGSWGGRLINIGKAGHINPDSGYGEWNDGVEILRDLDL